MKVFCEFVKPYMKRLADTVHEMGRISFITVVGWFLLLLRNLSKWVSMSLIRSSRVLLKCNRRTCKSTSAVEFVFIEGSTFRVFSVREHPRMFVTRFFVMKIRSIIAVILFPHRIFSNMTRVWKTFSPCSVKLSMEFQNILNTARNCHRDVEQAVQRTAITSGRRLLSIPSTV